MDKHINPCELRPAEKAETKAVPEQPLPPPPAPEPKKKSMREPVASR
jgi:hypothetical protein